MSHRTPPKSKTIARRLVARPTRVRPPRLGRGGAVAGERHAAALFHALLVEDVVLAGAAVAVALELVHRVVRVRLVPLPIPLGAAADQDARCDDDEEAPLPDHGGHDTMPTSAMLETTIAGRLPKPQWAGAPNRASGPLPPPGRPARGGRAASGGPSPPAPGRAG